MDESPRSLDIPSTTGAATTTVPRGNSPVFLYFTSSGELVATERDLESDSARAIVSALASGPDPGEAFRGLVSQLPPGVEIIDAADSAGVLRLDLSSEFDNITGRAKSEAAAQIVLSVTELEDIDEVVFFVDGKLSRITSPLFGDVTQVSACDFVTYLATPEKLSEVGASDKDVTHATNHRAELEAECGTGTG